MSPKITPASCVRSWVLAALLAVAVVAVPARTQSQCPTSFDCRVNCEPGTKEYQPQRCDNCCSVEDGAPSHESSSSDRLERVEAAVSELRVMTGVLLALVMVLVLVVIVLFLQLNKDVPKKFVLPVFFRSKKNTDQKTNCNGVVDDPNIGRLANHQSNSSPHARRVSMSKSTLGNTDLEPQSRPYRVRQPSESTCPEEGSDIVPQGYDNFALSTSTIDTSTLHNTSNSSTDTLGPALSTNTLHTTLPSENHISSVDHQNTRV